MALNADQYSSRHIVDGGPLCDEKPHGKNVVLQFLLLKEALHAGHVRKPRYPERSIELI